MSPVVHSSPSEHVVPLLAFGFEHSPVVVLQTPRLQSSFVLQPMQAPVAMSQVGASGFGQVFAVHDAWHEW